MEIKSLYFLTTFMVTMTSLLIITVASLIISDQSEISHDVEEFKDVLKIEVVENSFLDYYSVLNKTGGWSNLVYLCLGVGVGSFVISVFGYCGVHSKTCFLLISFLIINTVIIMLEIGVISLLNLRRREYLQLFYFSNYNSDISAEDFNYEVERMLLVVSIMWSVVTSLTIITNIVIQRRVNKKECEVNFTHEV